jgi:predicted ArsR family transcriptional regulator
LCKGELELFQAALGDDVRVTREQHLLAGDARCAYRITPAV